ncbi:hypothetical protein ACFCX4_35310 [Kitasatospora sp. NPDC056327]|uniref:hypothetical protein n=1 Tax=Kitasatospora sp. NPDC056327 TaxID=3345785 RepID=UPI0035E2D2E0
MSGRAAPAPAWPEEPPGPAADRVDVSVRALAGSYFDSEVTWTNSTDRRYDEIVPVVRALPYDHPSAAVRLGTTARGVLDRKDLDEWREVGLDRTGVGSGPQQGTFALDPGESRSVRHRLTPADGGMSGRLPIAAEGWVGRGARAVLIGGAEARLDVTVDRPVRSSATVRSGGTRGEVPSEVTVELVGLDAFAPHTAVPALTVRDPVVPAGPHRLTPENLTAEVLVGGEWRALRASADGEGRVVPDTSALARELGPGETAAHRFRFDVPKGRRGIGVALTTDVRVDDRVVPGATPGVAPEAPPATAPGTPPGTAPDVRP